VYTRAHLGTVQDRLNLLQRLVLLPFSLKCLHLLLYKYLNLPQLVEVEVPFLLQPLEVSGQLPYLSLQGLQLGGVVHSPTTNGGTTSCGAGGWGKGLYSA